MWSAIVVVLLWLGFAGSHVVLSSVMVRPRLIERLGLRGFLGLYSLVAFAFFVPLVWIYFAHKHAGPLLWSVPVPPAGRWLLYIGMGVAITLNIAGFIQPSPASVAGGEARVRGALRITRHPVFMGVALFGVLHLVPNGYASDVAFFSGFPLFTVIGCWHQDRRKLAAGLPGFRAFYEATPFFPFTGRQTWLGIREMFPTVIAIGVGVTILVRYFHPVWFGG